jgi:hypothetical protein
MPRSFAVTADDVVVQQPRAVHPRAVIALQAQCMPLIVVTVPEVPSRWSGMGLARAAGEFSGKRFEHRANMEAHGRERGLVDLDAAEGFGNGDHALGQRGPQIDLVAGWTPAEIHMSSVDPPPMSNTRTLRASGAISGLAPATASRASVSRSMTSSSSPTSSRTRAMNSAPLRPCDRLASRSAGPWAPATT